MQSKLASKTSTEGGKVAKVSEAIDNDPHLNEAILIAADYARLMNKKDMIRLHINQRYRSK